MSGRHRPAGSQLIAADIGNTSVAVGIFQGDELVAHWRLSSSVDRTSDEILHLLRGLAASGGEALVSPVPAILCSVVPALTGEFTRALAELGGGETFLVDHRADLGITNHYLDPGAVGPDRLANALAARELYGTPAVVVDIGTATTFDVVGAQGDYLGGVIAAGPVTSADFLFRRAARLPRIELGPPERVVGRTTEESVRSGIVLGNAILIDGLVERIATEIGGKPRVIATGGDAELVRDVSRAIEIIDLTLTLKGLNLAYRRLAS
jgi:type III pantothenate kinase